MASSGVFVVVFSFVAAIVSTTVLAKEFIVGDKAGWTTGVDYMAWARGKDFRVGDKLVFQYPTENSTFSDGVHKVNYTGFQECNAIPQIEGLYSGNDIITLTTPGKRYYMSFGGGRSNGCKAGQKLAIYVKDKMPEGRPYMAMAPTPTGSDKP